MQKITPFLLFDGKAEEAMNFCSSILKNSKIGSIIRYGEEAPGPTEAKIACYCGAATLFGPSRAGASSGRRKRFTSEVIQ
jgi:predicted 3-demethylubiquinone-9 3-methyltransferase (glyoxalase superfamily)